MIVFEYAFRSFITPGVGRLRLPGLNFDSNSKHSFSVFCWVSVASLNVRPNILIRLSVILLFLFGVGIFPRIPLDKLGFAIMIAPYIVYYRYFFGENCILNRGLNQVQYVREEFFVGGWEGIVGEVF